MTIAAANQGRFGAAFEWLGVERAWTRTRGSPDVVIGIVDEGVQVDHPLLGPNIQRDLAHNPASGGSHEIAGTHAAGVAAGRYSEVERFSGVAPEARILPVRFSERHRPAGARSRARHRIRRRKWAPASSTSRTTGEVAEPRGAARDPIRRRAQRAGGVFGDRREQPDGTG